LEWRYFLKFRNSKAFYKTKQQEIQELALYVC